MRKTLLMAVMSCLLVNPLMSQSVLANTPITVKPTPPSYTTPLYLNDKGHAYVLASINGVDNQPMIIDSAAQQSVLPLSLLPALQLDPTQLDTTTVTSATGTNELAEGVVNQTMVAGATQLDLEYIFTDMTGLNLPNAGEPGLLGHDFLNNYCVDMNFAAQRLTLILGACDKATVSTLHAVNIDTSTRFIRAQAGFAAGNVDVLLDTGAHHSFINNTLAQQITDLQVIGNEQTKGLTAHSQPRQVIEGLSYQLGSARVQEPKSYQADLHVFTQLGFQDKPLLLMGLRPFRQGRLVLDYHQQKMYFRQ